MTLVVRTGASLSTEIPPWAVRVGSGLICGANLNMADACYIEGLSGNVKPSLSAFIPAPTVPTVAGNGAGSAFGAGTYAVQTTYLTALGETTPSPAVFVVITANQNLRVNTQGGGVLPATVLSGNFYVNGVLVANTAASAGSIPQTDLVGATLAVAGSPPLVSSAYTGLVAAGTQNQHRVAGFAASKCLVAQNDAVTLWDTLDLKYGVALAQPPGTWLYLDNVTAGGLNDTAPTGSLKPVAQVLDSVRIRVWASRY